MAKVSKTKTKREWDEGLPALNRNAAGIDVGNAEHYVAVPAGRDPEPVQSFRVIHATAEKDADGSEGGGDQTQTAETLTEPPRPLLLDDYTADMAAMVGCSGYL
jgi:hypothetical protein